MHIVRYLLPKLFEELLRATHAVIVLRRRLHCNRQRENRAPVPRIEGTEFSQFTVQGTSSYMLDQSHQGQSGWSADTIAISSAKTW